MSVQAHLPLRDLQRLKDRRSAAIERSRFRQAARKDRKITRQVLAFLAALYGLPMGGSLIHSQIIEAPIYDTAHTGALRNTGLYTTGSVPCMTEFNFEAQTTKKTCAFPRRGGWTVTTRLADMTPSEAARYRIVQEKACAMAQRQAGYDKACAGLTLS